MKEIDLILKRILERAKQIAKLREENARDREIVAEIEGREVNKRWCETHNGPWGGHGSETCSVCFEGRKPKGDV